MVDTLTWWQQRTANKVIYWPANLQTAAAPIVTYALPPSVPPAKGVPAGHHLRQQYGPGYVSPSASQVPPPDTRTMDHTLGLARSANYLLNLPAQSSPSVQQWLNGPATMRLIGSAYDASNDLAYAMSVDSRSSAFDRVVHLQSTAATRLLN